MLRKWLIGLIQEALYNDYVLINRKLKEVLQICDELKSIVSQQQQQQQQEPESRNPLHTTRPSWMRMKREFEERDARAVLAARRAEGSIGRETSEFNEEANRVAEYWQNKQKGV